MNLRDLKYVIAVAETHHFGKAAEHCFVSQPTLSGQIKKLEEELGVTIFERTNRSVEITPVGKSILEHARLMMEQADVISQLAQAHQDRCITNRSYSNPESLFNASYLTATKKTVSTNKISIV